MTPPDPELLAALQALGRGFGPDQISVLDVHPTPPGRRPAPPPAPGPEATQPGLFDPEPAPAPPATTDPYSHLPPRRRWRAVLRHTAGAPTTTTAT